MAAQGEDSVLRPSGRAAESRSSRSRVVRAAGLHEIYEPPPVASPNVRNLPAQRRLSHNNSAARTISAVNMHGSATPSGLERCSINTHQQLSADQLPRNVIDDRPIEVGPEHSILLPRLKTYMLIGACTSPQSHNDSSEAVSHIIRRAKPPTLQKQHPAPLCGYPVRYPAYTSVLSPKFQISSASSRV